MSFFKKLFKNKKSEIIFETKMPDYIAPANKIFNKEYDSAILDLKNQLKKTNSNDYQTLSMIHINLMQAYFKNRNNNDGYFNLSTEHAKLALICGHNTGLAPFRLIVNLEKTGNLNKAIEVCQIITNDKYEFSKTGYKQKPEFIERLNSLNQKLLKKGDSDIERLFNDNEKEL